MAFRSWNRPSLRLLVCVLTVAGCAAPTGEGFVAPAASAVMFFADGMDAVVLREMLDAGELPAIRARFVDGGVTVERVVVSMPSITYPNAVSLITGRFPGHHGVLGNRWFDRYTLICRDYASADTYREVNNDFFVPTIYDMLHDRFTVSVQNHTRRGVTVTYDHVLAAGIDWGLRRYSSVDRRVGRTIDEIETLAQRTQRWPTMMTYYFPGLDEVGHRHGSDSADYRSAMRTIDAAIGRVFDKIERLGLLSCTSFALVTDHGHVPIGPGRCADVRAWLRARGGLNVYDRDLSGKTLPARIRELGDADAFVVAGAERCMMIHLRGTAGWHERPMPEAIDRAIHPRGSLLDALPTVEGVALVAARAGDDAVRVYSRDGQALVQRRRNDAGAAEYRYAIECGEDPLDYDDDPGVSAIDLAGWHGSREWLAATSGTALPDFVPQVVEMFDSPRAGDIVVFAAADLSFRREARGGHGSCVARDMLVTHFFAGPSLPARGRVETARLVDVMPTLLDLLGESAHLADGQPIDGVSIADALRHAATVTTP